MKQVGYWKLPRLKGGHLLAESKQKVRSVSPLSLDVEILGYKK